MIPLTVAEVKRLYNMAGVGPDEGDVLQSYENFTGGVLMSIVEHGFCTPEEVDEFLTLDNLTAPDGALPLNTSGGNLAECYMHGLGLVVEAVREVGGRELLRVPFTWPQASSGSAQGSTELGAITLTIKP